MPQDNIELLRAAYAAFGQGDEETMETLAKDYLHPEFELQTAFVGRTVRGYKGLQEFMLEVRENLGYLPVPEEFIDLGRDVLVVLRISGRGAQSGVPVDAQIATVWTIEDGRALRARAFTSREEALKAAGRSD
jgi:ketosteroid isomerase-like protein